MILLVAISHVNGYFAFILWLFPISKPRYKKKLIQKCYFKDWNSHISPYVAVFIQALRIFRKEGPFSSGAFRRLLNANFYFKKALDKQISIYQYWSLLLELYEFLNSIGEFGILPLFPFCKF